VTLRRALRAHTFFLALMALVVLAVGGGAGYVVQLRKNAALLEAFEHGSLHARAFEEQLTRSLENIQRLVDFIAAGSVDASPAKRDELFQRILRQAPFLRSLSMLDRDGRIIASSNPDNVGRQLVDAEYFPRTAVVGSGCLRVGRPWFGRDFNEGAPTTSTVSPVVAGLGFIPVLCLAEDGNVGVRLAAAVNPDYFLNYFKQWLADEDGFVDIVRYDRLVLLSSGKQAILGAQHPDARLGALLAESEIGRYQGADSGQRETLTAFRVSRQFPLVVVTHLFRDRALADWRRESGRMLAATATVMAGLAYLAVAVYRRDRRIVAEREAARRREYERLAATVFETVLEAVMVTDADQRIIAVNPAFTRITGYEPEEAVGADFSLLASGYHSDAFFQALQQSLVTRGHWEGEVRNRRKTGEVFVAWLSVNQVRDDAGHVLHLVTGFSDITEYCAEAERISHLAHHDLLMGLPNRALLLDRLRQGLRQAHRDGSRLAVIFFDLDKFKPVNDQLGHTVGDRLLQSLSARLLQEVRASDTLARLGGDEFVVLLPVMKEGDDALAVAEKIRQSVAQPVPIDRHLIRVSASIGVAFYPEHAVDGEELMRCADRAMYQAKAEGGDRFQVYQA
jgi:diguanylate cyclase (GGDEF)-like protein/PAS domain S-box-containing protein